MVTRLCGGGSLEVNKKEGNLSTLLFITHIGKPICLLIIRQMDLGMEIFLSCAAQSEFT